MAHYRDSLVACTVILLVFNSVAVAARLYSRLRITESFGADDVMLCLTYLGYIVLCGLSFTALHYGYAAEDDKPYSTLQPYYSPDKAKQFYFANQLVIYIDSGLIKLAVALVLMRIATTRAVRWLLIGSMGVVVVWTTVMTIYSSHLCAKAGTSNYAGSKTCNIVGYFRTTTNIVIDYFYALLPVYILWNVKMRLVLKLSVVFLLGLGIFASASTIVKLVIIIRLNHAVGDEAQHLHYQLLLWADAELGLAILAASLAAVRPLLARLHVPGLNKHSADRSSSARKPVSSSEAMGPYREIHDANPVVKGGTNASKSCVQHQVVTDIESHEMGPLEPGSMRVGAEQ
ncbi:hypothetical protein J3458_015594 [Metarhizium acridum]|uniref:Integral membrane protein n=1 Tax=Metarhizium acridum (strain CQMa 102) TaxID=655827 RepID=E9DQZ2_METAQ|nr:uncharacterized protein MAC_00161 [Metarhizium acridum CQMa 102]EFY93670.1 integral membrane protein [Metarhizium acridum CQMa 102]KAG8411537.1 hypothetical protein J3458_015594 [Metarhizium acridum]